MLNIAVVEDSQADADHIAEQLERYGKEKGTGIHAEYYREAESFLNFYQAKYDVVFMDIELLGINGMKASHRLRELDSSVILVFITSLKQFAIEGYEVDALDFVVKPVQYVRFASVMDRILARVRETKRDEEVLIRTFDGVKRLNISQVLFVEVSDHYVIYRTEERSYSVYSTLKKVKDQFPSDSFEMCNSGYLVNLRYVSGIEGDEVIVRSNRLKISRSRKKSFLEALNRYLGGL